MSLLAYSLLMFGCADDGTACERIAAPQQVYSGSAQCQAQIEPVLHSDAALRADYPVVEARCVKLSKQASVRPAWARPGAAKPRIFAAR